MHIHGSHYTVPTFNFCTKCVGSPDTIHDRLQPSFLEKDAWMTLQLNVALIRKLRGSFMCLAYYFVLEYYPWVCVQLGTGRRQLSDAGIKCLYCMWLIKLYLAVTSRAVASSPSQPRVWPCKMLLIQNLGFKCRHCSDDF